MKFMKRMKSTSGPRILGCPEPLDFPSPRPRGRTGENRTAATCLAGRLLRSGSPRAYINCIRSSHHPRTNPVRAHTLPGFALALALAATSGLAAQTRLTRDPQAPAKYALGPDSLPQTGVPK